MRNTASHLAGILLLTIAAAFTGCADRAVIAPDEGTAPLYGQTTSLEPMVQAPPASVPGVCDNISVPPGSRLVSHMYAHGVQIYRWTGASWSFVAPSAVLTSAPAAGVVGSHYGGPTWESLSGSKVVGAVRERCTPDPSAVAWLLLDAVSAEGPGIFSRVAFIQRVNTSGGLAPSAPGTFIDEEARIPYTTEYLFFRRD